jgi:hypothetical protein
MAVLDSLLRLRTYQRQQSALQLKQAEVERERQALRVSSLEEEIVTAQEQLPCNDLVAITDYHAWRLRQEITLRRETARLAQKERDVEIQQDRHGKNVRDELSIQNVTAAHQQLKLEEERHKEAHWMDEIAARSTILSLRKVR